VTDSPSQPDPVGLLAEDFLERYRRGDRPSISEYVRNHPDLAARIQNVFAALVVMEQAGRPEGEPTTEFAAAGAGFPRRLGDYCLVREVGRGGMGIVYEAAQEALGRRVALKVLPPEFAADPVCLKRFQREARAAARLHHTNIVPVHDVGEDEGLHYYAMQFIDGRSLDKVLTEVRRLWHGIPNEPRTPGTVSGSDISGPPGSPFYRAVARLGLQVAEALAYAHEQGVIHRDVKPSNILVDAAGSAWVTDFGLAKEEGEGLTRTGDVVGTLRYLPPERFSGGSDARGDVYGLGLTMYELLVGRPAFDESDRGRLIKRVLHDEPQRPRRWDRRVPRDLETIVLTASAKDPGRRYATASALAEDLRRYLADRPIRARRHSWLEQAWRWARRNPGWAAMGLAVTTLLLVIAVGGALLNVRLRSALDRATGAERDKTAKLWDSLVDRARALRASGRLGQRSESLAAIREAAQIRIAPELSREAAAALVLPDAEPVREWEGWPDGTIAISFDARLDRFVRLDDQGAITVGRLTPPGEEILARLRSRRQPAPNHILLSPAGDYVATWSGTDRPELTGSLDVWPLDNPEGPDWLGRPVLVNENAIAFSRDGRRLAVGHPDGTVSVFDPQARELVLSLLVGTPPPALAFDRQGDRLAVAAGSAVRLYDLTTGREEPPLVHRDRVSGVDWHPDGMHIATGCDDLKIHYWDVAAATESTAPWEGHTDGGITVWFNPSGDRLVSEDWGRLTRFWEVESGRHLLNVAGERGLQFGSDGLLCCQAEGKSLHLCRMPGCEELRVLGRHTTGLPEWFTDSIVQGDGAAMAIISRPVPEVSSRLNIFDLTSGKELASTGLSLSDVGRVAGWDPSGAWLTVGQNGILRWPARPDADGLHVGPPRRLSSQGGDRLGLSRNAQVLAVPQWRLGRTVVIDRRRPGRAVILRPQHDVRFASVSPDGRWVIASSHSWDGHTSTTRVWDAETGRPVIDLPYQNRSVSRFSPDGRWAAVGVVGRGCQLWEVGTWRRGRQFDNADTCFVFSPGSRLLAVNDLLGVIRLVDMETGAEVLRLTAPDPTWFQHATFSPDGTRLIAVPENRRTVYVWDLALLRKSLADLGLPVDWPEPKPAPGVTAGPTPATVGVDPGFAGNPTAADPAVAAAVLSISLALNPLNPQAYLDRGRAYSQLGEPWAENAAADYSAFLALMPGDDRLAEVLLSRANALARRQDYAASAADVRRLLTLRADGIDRPDQLALLADDLAWRNVCDPGAKREAAEAHLLAQKAVEIEPFRAQYRNTLGAVLFRSGRYQEAVDCLDRNVDVNSPHAGIGMYISAMSHQRLGRTVQARERFREAETWAERRPDLPADTTADLGRLRAEAAAVLDLPRPSAR
jgi:WD40 repeat protein/tRNA A-37 threonylcarbamoyl transferase component Bud32